MKKLVSLLLCVIMAFSAFSVTAFAAESDTSASDNTNLPMIFVTGIGQTFSFIQSDDATNEFNYKYADENGEFKEEVINYSQSKNLVNIDFPLSLKSLFSHPIAAIKSLLAIGELLFSAIIGSYTINYDRLSTLLKEILYLNIPDEDGNLPSEMFTPFYTYPVKYYNETAKNRFDRTVPHPDLISAYGEDRVFCFNYAPFGSIEKLADKLNDYINNVQERYFPNQKVILVPMSMGAATVSRYLYKYGDQGDVAKVISVVGCWDGSDVFADLIEGKYAEQSPEVFYTELMDKLIGDPATSSLIKIVLHLFSKDTLTPLARNAVKALCDEIILKSSTMTSLIPSDRYDAIRDKYLTRPGYEHILEDADKYHEAQSSLKTTLRNLNETVGTEFYFIAGYNLPFGSVTTDYTFFKCFESAWTTNSDEIIQIGSTTVGATAVAANTQFSQSYIDAATETGTDKYISPDKSLDLSTAAFPDNCFVFCNQKHELEYNNVAINLVLEIAKGTVKDINYDPVNYPQFNMNRNLKPYNGNYEYLTKVVNDDPINSADDAKRFSEVLGDKYAELKAEAQALIAEGDAMKATTVIDPESDAQTMEKFSKLVEEIQSIINGPQEKDFGTKLKDFFTDPLISVSDFIYSITGPKGIRDLI